MRLLLKSKLFRFKPRRVHFAGVFIVLYLMGYQPTLAFPPIKQSIVQAEERFSQKQSIQAASFSEAVNLPHPGYLTTKFSKYHPGVDIATGLGMPIKPILKGKVIETAFTFWGLGHYVVIEHEQGLKSTYGHMRKIYVKPGSEVTTSSIIGEVGMTGWTSGPHTHLEISKDGENINPQLILPNIPNFNDYAKVQGAVGQGGR